MEKKTTKKEQYTSACEIYVLEELKEMKELNKELTQENIDLRTKYKYLYELVMNALKTVEIDTTSSETFNHLKLLGNYVISYYKDKGKNSENEQEFLDLIAFTKRQVKRIGE